MSNFKVGQRFIVSVDWKSNQMAEIIEILPLQNPKLKRYIKFKVWLAKSGEWGKEFTLLERAFSRAIVSEDTSYFEGLYI